MPSADLGALGLKGIMKQEWEESRQQRKLWEKLQAGRNSSDLVLVLRCLKHVSESWGCGLGKQTSLTIGNLGCSKLRLYRTSRSFTAREGSVGGKGGRRGLGVCH